MQPRADIAGVLDEGILLLHIVVHGQVLGSESDLGLRDLALTIVLERQLQLCETIEELAREPVEEDGAVAVELGGDSKRGSPWEW